MPGVTIQMRMGSRTGIELFPGERDPWTPEICPGHQRSWPITQNQVSCLDALFFFFFNMIFFLLHLFWFVKFCLLSYYIENIGGGAWANRKVQMLTQPPTSKFQPLTQNTRPLPPREANGRPIVAILPQCSHYQLCHMEPSQGLAGHA